MLCSRPACSSPSLNVLSLVMERVLLVLYLSYESFTHQFSSGLSYASFAVTGGKIILSILCRILCICRIAKIIIIHRDVCNKIQCLIYD